MEHKLSLYKLGEIMRKKAFLFIFSILIFQFVNFPFYFKPTLVKSSSPPANGDWIVDDLTIIENDDIELNGSIIIESGGILILKNSIIRFMIVPDYSHIVTVSSGGNLTLIDSTLTTVSQDTDIYNKFTYYITLESGSICEINGGEISHAGANPNWGWDEGGLVIKTNDVIIRGCTFTENFIGITIKGSNLEIDDCVFDNNIIGIINWWGSNLLFSNNELINDGFWINGGTAQELETYTFDSNTINSKALYFILELDDLQIIDGLYGEIIIAFCNNIEIINSSVDGIVVWASNDVEINNCEIKNLDFGIRIYGESKRVDVIDCKFNHCTHPIHIWGYNITITNNELHNNIGLLHVEVESKDVLIDNNTITGTTYGSAIYSWGSRVKIINNEIYNCFTYSAIEIRGGWSDIQSEGGNNTFIQRNIMSGFNNAINILTSVNLTIAENIILNSHTGINLENVLNANVTLNTIKLNTYGLVIDSDSSNVLITLNNFIGNTYSAKDMGSNSFDNGIIGNYWSDYTGIDSNQDNIGDTPYEIDSNSKDNYPQMSPLNLHFFTYFISPLYGDIISGQVTIQWAPVEEILGEEFTYSLYYSIDEGVSWNTIAEDLVNSSYIWDISDFDITESVKLKIIACNSIGLESISYSGTFSINNTKTAGNNFVTGLITISLVMIIFYAFIPIIIDKRKKNKR